MHQSKKGNDWHFGMKAHIGVDAASGLVYTVMGTAANVSDVTQAHALLHGDETAALGDAGYQGVEKRLENVGKAVTWHVAMKRSKRKALPKNKLGCMMEKLEHLKASVGAKVEHPFHVIKNLFRHRKTRYRGLAKNTAQLFTLFGFAIQFECVSGKQPVGFQNQPTGQFVLNFISFNAGAESPFPAFVPNVKRRKRRDLYTTVLSELFRT